MGPIFRIIFVGCVFSAGYARANDSFAEVAAGGIKFLKQTDIVLQKEVLTISSHKVDVVYRFFNPTGHDLAITVAFPLPAYSFKRLAKSASPTYDFSVALNGRQQKFKTITEAHLDGKNVTAEVQSAGLPVADFRSWEGTDSQNPSLRLSAKARQQLIAEGLLDKNEAFPVWAASVTYVWEQLFPAGRATEVRHTYTPQAGHDLFSPKSADHGWSAASFAAGCTPSIDVLKNAIRPAGEGNMIFQTRIAYILTTANNWKTPIGEFALVVTKETDETVVLCSDLPAPRVAANAVEVSVNNYVPSRDLVVHFLAVHGPGTAPSAAR